MSFRLVYRQEPNYLFVEISGQWTTDSAEEAFEAIHSEANKRSITHLLLDTQEVSQPDSPWTRFRTGEHWAKIFGHPFKGAFLTQPDIFNGFAETVARNRFANVAAFFKREQALEWLLGGVNKADAGHA